MGVTLRPYTGTDVHVRVVCVNKVRYLKFRVKHSIIDITNYLVTYVLNTLKCSSMGFSYTERLI